MACYLFVHGNRHGSWAWANVVSQLQQLNHDAYAIDLPGRAGDATPKHTLTLETYRRSVIDYVNHNRLNDIILVGHSAGGVVLSAVVKDLESRLAGMVFVAALVLKKDESQLSHVTPEQQKEYWAIAQSQPDRCIPISYTSARGQYAFGSKDHTAKA